MENKNIILGVVGIVAAVVGATAFAPQGINISNNVEIPAPQVQTVYQPQSEAVSSPEIGAFPGPDMYANVNVHGTFIKGDNTGVATTTTATTYTFVEKDLMPFSLIDIMENTGAATFTLPATSTMFKLLGGSGLGSSREWLFHNATSSSGITMTLAKGAGMDLIAVTNADDVIDEGEYTRLTCSVIPYRTADNENIVCIVDELLNAD